MTFGVVFIVSSALPVDSVSCPLRVHLSYISCLISLHPSLSSHDLARQDALRRVICRVADRSRQRELSAFWRWRLATATGVVADLRAQRDRAAHHEAQVRRQQVEDTLQVCVGGLVLRVGFVWAGRL